MIFKKIIIGIFISTLFHSYLFADVLNLRNIYDVKIFSTAKLEINDTNLIDADHAKDLLKNVKELKAALDKESKKINEQLTSLTDELGKLATETPKLSKQIVAINAAIGRDETLDFAVQNTESISKPGASFVYHDKEGTTTRKIKGYSLENAIKEFDIPHIDLLKMDCKGCEFFLSDEDLKDIDRIKIEYSTHGQANKLENLLKLLKQNGFQCMIYRHSATSRFSNLVSATIFASRI